MSKDKKINFGLLENGLDFILSAIINLKEGDDKVKLKYGVLHLSAGVDLIFKYLLSKEHGRYYFIKLSMQLLIS